LLQQKRNELEKCKNNLQEATSKAVKLQDEVEKERECISQLRYNLANTWCIDINVTGKSDFFS